VPVAIAGVKGEGAHQSDECVWLSSIKQYGAIAAEFARRLAKM
jgi:acetylornithine deacetylase/succinyl-diaminopimelate desuccinylase-like protein